MKEHFPSAVSRVRVESVVQDAKTLRERFAKMTTPFRHAGDRIGAIVEELEETANLSARVSEQSLYVQDVVDRLIRLMDGDFSESQTERLSPHKVLQEAYPTFEVSMSAVAATKGATVSPQLANMRGAAKKVTRNPPWTRDEIILATEVYIQNDGRVLGPNDGPVKELSVMLNKLPIIPLAARNEKFRNPEGVGLKLANIRAADPDRPGGSPHGNRLDGLFWTEMGGDEAALLAESLQIKRKYQKG